MTPVQQKHGRAWVITDSRALQAKGGEGQQDTANLVVDVFQVDVKLLSVEECENMNDYCKWEYM